MYPVSAKTFLVLVKPINPDAPLLKRKSRRFIPLSQFLNARHDVTETVAPRKAEVRLMRRHLT